MNAYQLVFIIVLLLVAPTWYLVRRFVLKIGLYDDLTNMLHGIVFMELVALLAILAVVIFYLFGTIS